MINVIAKVVDVIMTVVNTAIDGINFLIRAYNAIPFLGNIGEIQKMGTGAAAAQAQKTVSETLSGLGSLGQSGGAVGGSASQTSIAASAAAAKKAAAENAKWTTTNLTDAQFAMDQAN